MSGSSTKFQWGRRMIAALAFALALACGLMPASAADPAASAEDRRRFVSVARQLEQAPLEPRLAAERGWAFEWLMETPDVSVTICANLWSGLMEEDYPHGGEILIQSSLSMAAAMLERPDITADPIAQQYAGAEGALESYRSILRSRPRARSPFLDALVRTQSRGELREFIANAWPACSSQD